MNDYGSSHFDLEENANCATLEYLIAKRTQSVSEEQGARGYITGTNP